MQHSFNALGVSAAVEQALAAIDIVEPFRIQSLVLPDALAGRDVLAKAPTGSGKTIAFGIPLVERVARDGKTPEALVLVPTRELALQVADAIQTFATAKGIRVGVAYGGAPVGSQAKRLKGAHIVVATPGRLQDLIERKMISMDNIKILVLDEADRMLDMGFLPQMRRIIKEVPRARQTLLFSATLSREIEQITKEMQHDPKVVEIGRRANPADTVTQFLYPVSRERKIDLLLHLLRDQNLDSVLVFSRTKHGADKISRKLTNAGLQTAALHSNRSQSQRVKALEAFRAGKVRVLVATDIAARGIDVEGISHVINFDFPMNPEDYVHRIGRTGRAEAIGDAISFITTEDGPYVRDLEKMIGRRIERRSVEGFSHGESTTTSAHRPWQQQRSRNRARVW